MRVLWKMNRTMALNLFKLIFLWITFFNLATRKPKGAVGLRYCSEERNNDNSTSEANLRTLLSSLSSNASAKGFYINTVPDTDSFDTDTVYGLFMCRGDLLSHACEDCVANATQTLSSDCSLSKSSVIWYEECMVRYSNLSFFSTMYKIPEYYMCNWANISSDPSSFMSLLNDTMKQTAKEAAGSVTRYSAKQENLTEAQTLYCLAQCTQDLSLQQCLDCLYYAIITMSYWCDGKQGGRGLLPSCNIRYELYPFYRVADEAPKGLVPETKHEHTDSEYSEDPGYISHNCSNNKLDAAFQSNLRTLLSDLSSNATTSRYGFQTQEGTAYGLFRCRMDIHPHLCEQCIKNATDKITSDCGLAYAEAVIWYNHCWLRYSDINFFSTVERSPRFGNLNISNTSPIQSSVASDLSNKLAKVATMTGNTDNKFETDESLRLNDKQRVYVLAQCSSDLSTNSCIGCLSDMIGTAIPWSSLGSVGGRVLCPSCILRFELFRFYNLTPTTPSAPPPPSPGFSISILYANKRKDKDSRRY